MSWVVVEIVGDEAAAAVLLEALAAHQVPAQRRRVPGTPYGPARLEIEVRVPADRLADAEAIVGQLAEEAEAAARRESRMTVGEPLDPPRRRPSNRWQLAPRRDRVLLVLAAGAVALLTLYGALHTVVACPR